MLSLDNEYSVFVLSSLQDWSIPGSCIVLNDNSTQPANGWQVKRWGDHIEMITDIQNAIYFFIL